MRKIIAVLISIFCQQILWAQTEPSPTAWGDLGDGTYANPVLLSDYSDPDIIRVGKKYYMICSEFHFMGMPVLESDDMVNWRIVSQIYRQIEHEQFNNIDRLCRWNLGTSLALS